MIASAAYLIGAILCFEPFHDGPGGVTTKKGRAQAWRQTPYLPGHLNRLRVSGIREMVEQFTRRHKQ